MPASIRFKVAENNSKSDAVIYDPFIVECVHRNYPGVPSYSFEQSKVGANQCGLVFKKVLKATKLLNSEEWYVGKALDMDEADLEADLNNLDSYMALKYQNFDILSLIVLYLVSII